MVEMIRTKVEVDVVDHEATGLMLRRWRKWHKLTMGKVAAAANMSTGYLSQLETGHLPWNEFMFARVVHALQTLTGESEPCIPG